MKIVVNRCLGEFGLTIAVFDELKIKWNDCGCLGNKDFGIKSDNNMAYRADNKLIAAIEKIGIEKSTAGMAELEIIDIPNDIEWEINSYDGEETVHEQHRSW